MKLTKSYFLPLFLLSGCFGPDYSKNISLFPVEPKAGDTIRIALDNIPTEHSWSVDFSGRRFPMFPGKDGSVRTFVGLNGEWQPGPVEFRFYEGDRRRNVAKSAVFISTGVFPFEDLKMAANKTELIRTPAHIEAKAKIAAVLGSTTTTAMWTGRFELPVKGRLNTVYGMRRRVNKKINWPYHKGLDVGAPNGTPIGASNAGRVVLAERFPIHGRTVIIDHGQGVMTAYLHMSMFVAPVGAIVKKGEIIGKVGSDGFSTGPHVHGEFYVFGEPVDPWRWMEKDFEDPSKI